MTSLLLSLIPSIGTPPSLQLKATEAETSVWLLRPFQPFSVLPLYRLDRLDRFGSVSRLFRLLPALPFQPCMCRRVVPNTVLSASRAALRGRQLHLDARASAAAKPWGRENHEPSI